MTAEGYDTSEIVWAFDSPTRFKGKRVHAFVRVTQKFWESYLSSWPRCEAKIGWVCVHDRFRLLCPEDKSPDDTEPAANTPRCQRCLTALAKIKTGTKQ